MTPPSQACAWYTGARASTRTSSRATFDLVFIVVTPFGLLIVVVVVVVVVIIVVAACTVTAIKPVSLTK